MNPFPNQQTMELVTCPGTPFVLLKNDKNFTHKAIEAKTLALETAIAELPEVKALSENDYLLDLGGFVGDTAFIFSRSGATVVAIEAQLDAYLCLHFNSLSMPTVIAVYATMGDGGRFSPQQNELEGNLGTRSVALDASANKSTTVDEIVEKLRMDKLTGLKADAEGMEWHILDGARKTLRTLKPWLLVEVYHEMLERVGKTAQDIYDLLEEEGYAWEVCIGDLSEPRFDIMCKPKEAE